MLNHSKFPTLRIVFTISLVAACHGLSAQELRPDAKPVRTAEGAAVHVSEAPVPARGAEGSLATTLAAQPSRDFDFDLAESPAPSQHPARDFDFDLGG
jgi:hypothetical protein